MSRVKINIWNRDFELNAILHHFPDETITDDQEKALEDFCKAGTVIADSKEQVEKYILTHGLEAKEVDNIFKYVMPKSLYIPREKTPPVAILCNYKFDMEHGLAIVYENGKLKEIGAEDIIL